MTTPENQPAPNTPTPAPTEPAKPAQAETDWKAEARKHEARAKENAAAASELAKLKQAQMTETDRLNAQLADSQKAAASAASEALRWRVAARHGISDEQAEMYLSGDDEAMLTRQAEGLVALAQQQVASPAGPRPDLSQGAKGASSAGGPAADFAAHLKTHLGR